MPNKNQNKNKKKVVNTRTVVVDRTVRVRRKRNRIPRSVANCPPTYAECVLGSGGVVAKVPDAACHSVLLEYNLAFTATCQSGELVVLARPGLPCSAIACTGKFTAPNMLGLVTPFAITTARSVMIPFTDFPMSGSGTAPGASLYNSSAAILRARCVSYKMQVTPVGTIVQQGGKFAAARVPMDLNGPWYGKTQPQTVGGIAIAGTTRQPYVLVRNGPVNYGYSEVSSYPDAVMKSGTQSVVMLGITDDDDFDPVWPVWRDNTSGAVFGGDTLPWAAGMELSDQGADNTDSAHIDIATASQLPSGATITALSGNFWDSRRASGLVWAGSGLPQDQSYEFRITACMELCISHEGSTYRPFVTSPAPRDLTQITKVRDIVAKLPAAIPAAGTNAGWWSNLTSAVSGVGEFVRDLNIPVVSTGAALVGKLANAIGGLNFG